MCVSMASTFGVTSKLPSLAATRPSRSVFVQHFKPGIVLLHRFILCFGIESLRIIKIPFHGKFNGAYLIVGITLVPRYFGAGVHLFDTADTDVAELLDVRRVRTILA